jgi:hypothetical protein
MALGQSQKHQAPNPKFQTNRQVQMFKGSKLEAITARFGHCCLAVLNLFGTCDLVLGAFARVLLPDNGTTTVCGKNRQQR